jgi:galactose mutarotase-like enzyme
LTNHTYFNLSGNLKRKVTSHQLQLSCDLYLPVDSNQIPTGDLASVNDTLFDFRKSSWPSGRFLSEVIPNIDGGGQPGLDHCFVVNGAIEYYSIKGIIFIYICIYRSCLKTNHISTKLINRNDNIIKLFR